MDTNNILFNDLIFPMIPTLDTREKHRRPLIGTPSLHAKCMDLLILTFSALKHPLLNFHILWILNHVSFYLLLFFVFRIHAAIPFRGIYL